MRYLAEIPVFAQSGHHAVPIPDQGPSGSRRQLPIRSYSASVRPDLAHVRERAGVWCAELRVPCFR